MSRKTIYNKNISAPAEITNEEYESVGSGKFQLGDSRRFFLGANDFEIYTEASSGKKLAEGTDYQLLDLDAELSTLCNKPVYSYLSVTKAEYQICKLYFNYKCVYSQLDAKQINTMQLQIDANKSSNESQDETLANHDSRITDNSLKNSAQDNTIAEIIAKNTVQDEAHSTHVNNADIHVSVADKSRWDGKATPYLVNDLAARDSLTGLNINDVVYVKNDGDGKRAGYYYNGPEESPIWEKFYDPDWENIDIDWSAVENVPQVLQDLSDSGTGELLYKGEAVGGGSLGETIITNINEDYVTPVLTQNTKLYFAPSQDRACDITAGAASVGTKLFLYHSGSGDYKETITYAVGQTLILTRNMFVELERVPGGWLFVRESRIGQLDEGLILPRGAVQLDGSLRTKDALWHYISEYYAALIVTNAVWLAGDCLKFVNYSETQYRIPDWRGIFSRNSGANSILKTANNAAFSGGGVAAIKLDMFHGHRMYRNPGGASEVTARSAVSTGLIPVVGGYTQYNVTTTGDPVTDGVNGDPRTGNQTQPVSGSKIAYIYAED